MGVGTTYSFLAGGGSTGNTGCSCSINKTQNTGFSNPTGSGGFSLIFPEADPECAKIAANLGTAWMGCFWPDPMAPFSCNCPLYGDMYENYLKYRLGSATFWNTPIDAPVKRQYFNESIKDMIDITIAGDFSERPGDIVYIKVDNLTGLVTQNPSLKISNIKSGYYYIVRIKNVMFMFNSFNARLSFFNFL